MREITLRNTGNVALVSDSDYSRVCGYGWYEYKKPDDYHSYVRCSVYLGSYLDSVGKRHTRTEAYQLHRMVVNADASDVVTFRDSDPLNCQRENLVVTQSRTLARAHGRGYSPRKSQYRGVGFAQSGLFTANVFFEGRNYYLGLYSTQRKAALSYDQLARELYGDMAQLNFPNIHDYSTLTTDKKQFLGYVNPLPKKSKHASKYIGVYWLNGKWIARICHQNLPRYLGSFENETDAAKEYDREAKLLRGRNAIVNFK